jgi:ribonuclease D
VAVDTESNSLFAYREQVCLVQFSTTQADFLVDPLALADLTPLAPLFADPKIEKVFHAAEYDLLCLKRDFGFSFANLFDTMLAGRILGRKEIGLGAMLEAFYGVQADKRHQRANWGQRPLPAPLLEYATLDTHYLIPLRDAWKPS